MSTSYQFTPLRGFLAIGEYLARRIGCENLWHGKDGMGQVIRERLTDAGVPEAIDLTPRAVMQEAGVIRKPRKGGRKSVRAQI